MEPISHFDGVLIYLDSVFSVKNHDIALLANVVFLFSRLPNSAFLHVNGVSYLRLRL